MGLERAVGPGHAESKSAKEFGLCSENSGEPLEGSYRERDQRRGCSKPCWLLCRAEVGGRPQRWESSAGRGQYGSKKDLGVVQIRVIVEA